MPIILKKSPCALAPLSLRVKLLFFALSRCFSLKCRNAEMLISSMQQQQEKYHHAAAAAAAKKYYKELQFAAAIGKFTSCSSEACCHFAPPIQQQHKPPLKLGELRALRSKNRPNPLSHGSHYPNWVLFPQKI